MKKTGALFTVSFGCATFCAHGFVSLNAPEYVRVDDQQDDCRSMFFAYSRQPRRSLHERMLVPTITGILSDMIGDASVVDGSVASVFADVLGDLTFGDISMYVAASALGAVSQIPRISNLQEELTMTKIELVEEKKKVSKKLEELEEKLSWMDVEWERQTETFKTEYDTQVKSQLNELVGKIKSDYKRSMRIRMDELKYTLEGEASKGKSEILAETMNAVNSIKGDTQEKLVELKVQNAQMTELKGKLEAAVTSANKEIERLKQQKKNKNNPLFPPF